MCGIRYLKVCLTAYLFLCLTLSGYAQHRQFPEKLLPYYHQALNYDFRSWPLVDIDTLSIEDQSAGIYINALAATFSTIIAGQDPASEVRDDWNERTDQCSDSDEFCHFVQAEVAFHYSLVSFIKGEHFKSFLQFRKVYRAKDDEYQHPWSNKTYGMLNVLLTAVPEQYQWIMGLLGYRSDQLKGIQQLQSLVEQQSQISLEAWIVKLMLEQYIFDQNTFNDWLNLRTEYPDSPLIQFLFNANALKNHQSQYVIDRQVDSHIDQVYGQLGEAFLNKLEYDSALTYFKIYEDNLEERMTAEMLHKIWLCHKLKSDSITATIYANKLLTKDESISEADENAIFNLQLGEEQDLELMKVRLSTDGGYYQLAGQILEEMDSASLSGRRSQVEYIYRKARWLHLMGQPKDAVPYYEKVLADSPKTGWYFAPNTAYQLGLIFESFGEVERAVEYYEMIKNYRGYPYRNSLENKSNLRMRIIDSKN